MEVLAKQLAHVWLLALQAQKKGNTLPEIQINVADNALKKPGARFLCNVRFKNDLPEV